MNTHHAIKGNLLGLAVGDSIGLPFEGLCPKRRIRLFGKDLCHCLLWNKGMFSDDTEHSCMIAQSLISHFDNHESFAKCFANKLRFWLLGLPVGIGMSTLKSILKLCVGISIKKSGVFSAGNGPAMRSSVIGVFFYDDYEQLKKFVYTSTIISHTDPKAYNGALTIALASSIAIKQADISPQDFYKLIVECIDKEDSEYLSIMRTIVTSIDQGESTMDFAKNLGLEKGVSGYMYHTVPVVIHCWLTNQCDYKKGITEIIECGGDSDTTASILGGIIGARVGKEGIPEDWLKNIADYPRSIQWIEGLSDELARVKLTQQAGIQKKISVPVLILRNILFFIAVLTHGFRRLLPPY
ncbi:MAG: ADP-ribosylglycohydrolase family protein [Candidatus Cloacimonetes bacterium]|nr:ADP-ribosylglycohydrolase family protein [Candidatus Cloacimonadota bacterium]